MRVTGDVPGLLESVNDAGGAAGGELGLGCKLAGGQFARACELLDGEHLGLCDAESSG